MPTVGSLPCLGAHIGRLEWLVVGRPSLSIRVAGILHCGSKEWQVKLLKLLRVRVRIGTVLFPMHSVGQNKSKSSEASRDRIHLSVQRVTSAYKNGT